MSDFAKLLKNKNFVLYSLGQAFSQFGDRLVQIILIGYVYKKWPGSTFQLAKLFFFTVVPSFFISPIAGVYIDRWNRKVVLVLSDLFRGLAVLSIPLFFIYRDSIIPVYAAIFFIFAAACFFLPTRLSVIPNLVSHEELLLANSASAITWVISGIAGFSLGGYLAEWIGIEKSLYINSIFYFLSAASFLILNLSGEAKKIVKRAFLDDLKIGLKTLFFSRKMKFVMYTFFIFSSLVGACYAVLVVFVQETLHSMTRYVGLLGMCVFLGVFAGSFIYGKIGEKISRGRTVFVSLLLTGISMVVFAIGLKSLESVIFGGMAAFFIGLFLAPAYVTANTIVHESIDTDLRGRIFSSLGIIMNFGFLIFMFFSSYLAEFVDRFWILVLCGSVFALFGLIELIRIPKGFLEESTFSS